MKVPSCFLPALASLTLCHPALAEDGSPEAPCAATPQLCWSMSTGPVALPSTGIDALASGGVLTAMGSLSFATAPICKSSVVPAAQQGSCFTVSFWAGATLIVLGVPLIVFGAVQHAKYNDWARKHPTLTGLSFSPTPGGGAIAWGGRF